MELKIRITLRGRMELEIIGFTKWASGVPTVCYFLIWVIIIQMSSLYDNSWSYRFIICVLISRCYISSFKNLRNSKC